MRQNWLKRYAKDGTMIKRADGSYSQRGLWDNIRANAGSGKKPTPEMLKQEKKIRAAEKKEYGGTIGNWWDELSKARDGEYLSHLTEWQVGMDHNNIHATGRPLQGKSQAKDGKKIKGFTPQQESQIVRSYQPAPYLDMDPAMLQGYEQVDKVAKQYETTKRSKGAEEVYNRYKQNAKAYLSRPQFNKSPLTADNLAEAARDFYKETGYEFPLDLALAQGQMESGLGTHLKTKNNVWNVGNFGDDSQSKDYDSPTKAAYSYMNTMYNNYLDKGKRSPSELLNKGMINAEGHRYDPTNPKYEQNIKEQIGTIRKYMPGYKPSYEFGGKVKAKKGSKIEFTNQQTTPASGDVRVSSTPVADDEWRQRQAQLPAPQYIRATPKPIQRTPQQQRDWDDVIRDKGYDPKTGEPQPWLKWAQSPQGKGVGNLVDRFGDATAVMGAGEMAYGLGKATLPLAKSYINSTALGETINDIGKFYGDRAKYAAQRYASPINIARNLNPEYKQVTQNQLDEGIDWLKNWHSDPITQRKMRRNDLDLITGSSAKDIIKNRSLPVSTEDRFAEGKYKPQFDNPIMDVLNMRHSDNLGVYQRGIDKSYVDRYPAPEERLILNEQGLPKWDKGTNKLQQTTNYIPGNIKSTTIHEGTHTLTQGDRGLSSENYKLLGKDMFPTYEYDPSKIDPNEMETPESYYTRPTEVHARINELRSHYNLKPGQHISESRADDILDDIKHEKTPVSPEFADYIIKYSNNDSYGRDKLANAMNKMFGVAAPVGIGAAALSQNIPESLKPTVRQQNKYGGKLTKNWLQNY